MTTLKERKNKVISFVGPMVASVTPFTDAGRANGGAIEEYVNHLVKIGVKGAYVHGTTGEGVSLNHEEKKMLTKQWVHVVRKKQEDFLLVINVSSCCIDDVLDHAKLCQELQVDAIAFLPPFYHRPKDASDLARYVQMICKSVPDIPVFYYHFPEMTGVRIAPSQWIPLVLDKCSNFSAIKYTDKDMCELSRCITMFKGKVTLYPGYEDTILTASALGAKSFIGALFNLPNAVELAKKIVDAIEGCRMCTAKEEQDKFVQLIDNIFAGAGLITNLKLKLKTEHQINVGLPRPPIHYI